MKNLRIIWLVLLMFCCSGNVLAQTNKKNLYGIFVDNSKSLNSQLKKIKEIGKELTKDFVGKGQISVFNFQTSKNKVPMTELKLGLMWSQDQKSLNEYIESIEPVNGQTTLLDAVFSISVLATSKFESDKENLSEKILVLITDGEDRASNVKSEELIKFVKENKIRVFVIGLMDEFNDGTFVGTNPQIKIKEFLGKITKETNGRVIFPKSKQKAEEIVKNLFSENRKSN